MVFVSIYSLPPENRTAAEDRFKQTGGKPPKGVKMIGRWHSAGGGRGVTIFEADDPQAIARWSEQWTDLISFDVYPALDDSAFAKVLSSS
jgi:Domain of unknown function (DUF3303)